ncbi:fumarylacetoacetase [Mesorhizobium soli]|uniref:fumarylacetoacetase n=1 Tax=Pseudaminobacter soli (ex Li et al. 2025) TaxID=1295366 RepID=UPI0024731FE7|nr:fumarylacetoacetase [Mesorhizobium soli]MDH6229755.1 fumarylacetoacetase [Mesorhizobium soli]
MLNETHDPHLRSWVASANLDGTDFPIQNLPHGVFRRRGETQFRGGIAIGDQILDMSAASATDVFSGLAAQIAKLAGAATLNDLMAAGPAPWSALRLALSRSLREGSDAREKLLPCLVTQADAEFALPAVIGDFTDFFTSWHHMINAGKVLAPPGAPPLPNFKWLPMAYHGRSSSIEISGAPLHRPVGQTRIPGETEITFGPSRWLDHEVELGLFVGPGNARGIPITVDEAEDHLFGLCLLNDWSARDIQAWESMPLGPFLAKNFLTTISPWIVTMEALAPYRAPLQRSADDPSAFSYLNPSHGTDRLALDITLEAWLEPVGGAAQKFSRSNYQDAYWAPSQLIAHHTRNGCNLRAGDLLGTGTQSGNRDGEKGSMLETSEGGKRPLPLPNGDTRSFLEDGDTLTVRGHCERPGFARIGFGECKGSILPAISI